MPGGLPEGHASTNRSTHWSCIAECHWPLQYIAGSIVKSLFLRVRSDSVSWRGERGMGRPSVIFSVCEGDRVGQHQACLTLPNSDLHLLERLCVLPNKDPTLNSGLTYEIPPKYICSQVRKRDPLEACARGLASTRCPGMQR